MPTKYTTEYPDQPSTSTPEKDIFLYSDGKLDRDTLEKSIFDPGFRPGYHTLCSATIDSHPNDWRAEYIKCLNTMPSTLYPGGKTGVLEKRFNPASSTVVLLDRGVSVAKYPYVSDLTIGSQSNTVALDRNHMLLSPITLGFSFNYYKKLYNDPVVPDKYTGAVYLSDDHFRIVCLIGAVDVTKHSYIIPAHKHLCGDKKYIDATDSELPVPLIPSNYYLVFIGKPVTTDDPADEFLNEDENMATMVRYYNAPHPTNDIYANFIVELSPLLHFEAQNIDVIDFTNIQNKISLELQSTSTTFSINDTIGLTYDNESRIFNSITDFDEVRCGTRASGLFAELDLLDTKSGEILGSKQIKATSTHGMIHDFWEMPTVVYVDLGTDFSLKSPPSGEYRIIILVRKVADFCQGIGKKQVSRNIVDLPGLVGVGYSKTFVLK